MRSLQLPFALAAALLLLAGCALFQPRLEQPSINLVGFRLNEASLFQQRYTLVLAVQNPNRLSIPVRGMRYTLTVAGDEFARGVSPRQFTLPAYGEAEIEVEMTTNLISSLRRLQALLQEERSVVDYELSGHLDVASEAYDGILPFQSHGELRLQ